ncbi:AAA family ATPase [uncultured Thiohalocapsa sp.]|uniref:AAA family ATPase n=1 Tax=uncultured Thiohalocapsa sp. TaxID=768990 RepID=UPI0025EF6013|nr:AAA family ATPase [uncultured Thiohalocapsa sp.]
MHLQRLKLRAFRNLRDLEVRFSASARDAEGRDLRLQSHAIIGPNGSGKSNLLEALVTIFRDLDLNQPPGFDYELDYEIRGYSVAIRATAGEPPRVQIDGVATDPFELSDIRREHPETGRMERGKARRYLPSNVFTYYSGKNERLEALFREHQQAFINNLNEVDAHCDDATGFDDTSAADALVRRLFYCRHPHAKLVLLSLLLAPEQPLKEILDDLRIVDLDSALFVLKQPWRLTAEKLTREDIRQGSPRFWYDRTRFTEELLEKLWELAVAPIDHTAEQTIDFRGRVEEQALLYLFVDSRDKLTELKNHVGDSYRFFRFLEGAYIADLLEDLHLYVRHQQADGLMTFDQLSEGELQLLTVLGLMRLIHGSDWDQCLFLLDEPDTHLNPLWKLRYFERVEQVLREQSDGPLKGDSQIIVTTHDPMMIGSLRREQVHILRQGSRGVIEVDQPIVDPRGMGVAGLLKSELFGLRSTVDTETLRRLDRRNLLFARGEERTAEETAEMQRLSDELSELGFAQDFKEPYYALFVRKMAQHTRFHQPTLTPEQMADQEAIAERIIREVLAEDAGK